MTPKEERDNISIEHAVGFELTRKCLGERRITAFVAVNDMVAYGVLDAIRAEGRRVPEDYSVCGFDNIFPSQFLPVGPVSYTHLAAADKDCDTLAYTTYRDAENEIRILNAVAGSDLAGVVFTMMPQSTELVERVNRLVPVVVIGDRNTSLNVDTVEMNNYSAGAIIAHYMICLLYTSQGA